jgi:hypothetical protein
MRKKVIIMAATAFVIFSLRPFNVSAQLSLTGQLRTRTEWRDGAGTLKPSSNKAAFFTSQRTRLTFGYKWNRITFQASVQDIRVWGQDASSISNSDGSRLGVHEAWADIVLSGKKDTSFKNPLFEYLSVKIGRQELLYDDSRLLGNLDWLQQARRHDAIVFKMLEKGWQIDLGAAFNQNTDAFNYNGTYYIPANVPLYTKDSKGNLVPTPAGLIPIVNAAGSSAKTGSLSLSNPPSTNSLNQHYKALQFLYISKTIKRTKFSALLVSDQFSNYMLDSVKTTAGSDTGYIYGRRYNQAGVHSRFTTGLLATALLDKKKLFTLTAGAYYQGGKDKEGLSLSAYTSTLSLGYVAKKWSYLAGWDYVSGNDAFSTSTVNHRFDPLYGTPHKFWGLMDYFYAGTGSPSGGLNNPYVKIRYTSMNKRFSTGLDYHYFALAKDQKDNSGQEIDKYLGSEFDWVTNYGLNKITTLELGVSYLAASNGMEYAKGVIPGSSDLHASWVYLQINIKPDFLNK